MAFADLPESVQAEYRRIGREREQASREADRAARWALVRVCAEMFAWTVAGVVVAGMGFWVGDSQLGRVFLLGGIVINVSGVAISIWAAYLKGEERGDW